MTLKAVLLAAILPLGLVACASDPAFVLDDRMIASPEFAESVLSNATIVTRDANQYRPQYGTQIEYLSPDGKTYLWFPRNQRIVQGEWKVQPNASGKSDVCFRYGANSRDPVTGKTGGAWECGRKYFAYLDILSGNPFGLRAGAVPVVIPDLKPYYPEHIMVMLGKDPAKVPYRSKSARAASLDAKIASETGMN